MRDLQTKTRLRQSTCENPFTLFRPCSLSSPTDRWLNPFILFIPSCPCGQGFSGISEASHRAVAVMISSSLDWNFDVRGGSWSNLHTHVAMMKSWELMSSLLSDAMGGGGVRSRNCVGRMVSPKTCFYRGRYQLKGVWSLAPGQESQGTTKA